MSAEKEVENIVGVDLDTFRKKWKDKFKYGSEFKDDDLLHISTGSAKLDWALKRPFLEGSMVEIFAPNATGKAQPLSSLIMTPSGPVQMKSIKIGDIVCTPNGKTAKITDIFPQGIKEVFRVIFSDGTNAESTLEHLWLTQNISERHWLTKRCWSVKTLETIKDSIKYNNSNNHRLPITEPVFFNKQHVEIKPYVLGLLIGDGYLPKNWPIKISTADNEIVDWINNNFEYKINRSSVKGYDYHFLNSSSLRGKLEKLGLAGCRSYEKFIPESYKINSIEDRFELLKGLMDTDGTIGKNGDTSYCTTSEKLADDVVFLVQSLGGVASKNKKQTYYTNGVRRPGRPAFNIHITMPRTMIPFKLTKKINRWKFDLNGPHRYITGVEYIRNEECQCIKIDSEDELYLTDNFAVTHNTTLALQVCANAMRMGKLCFYLDLEFKLRESQLNMIEDFDKSKFNILFPENGEECMNLMHELISTYPGCVIVLDSVGGILSEVEDTEDFNKQTMGGISKLMHKMIRKLSGISSRNKCVLIFLNHLTSTMTMYGSPNTTHGGNAVRNRAAQRIELKALSAGAIKDGDEHIGQYVRATVVKNNVNRPFITVEFPIIYGRGIDWALDMFEFAKDLGIITGGGKGGWYTIEGEEKKYQKEELLTTLRSDAEFKSKLQNRIKEMVQ